MITTSLARTFGAGCVVLHTAVTSLAAEAPTRFLAVESWRGSFSQDMSVMGSKTYDRTGGGQCTVTYSLVHHVNPSVVLTNLFRFGDLGYWLSDGARIPNAGNVAERFTLTCPAPEPEHTERADGSTVEGIFQVQIDAAANQYVIQLPSVCATITIITPEGTFPGPELCAPLVPIWLTNTLPATGLVLSGSAAIRLDRVSPVIFLPVPLQPADLQQVLRANDLVVGWSLEPYGAGDFKIISVQAPTSVDGLHTFVSSDNIVLKAQARPGAPGLQVNWTVEGRDAAAGIGGFPANERRDTDAQGVSTFTFSPANNAAFVRNRQTVFTTASLVPNAPISFEVTAELQGGTRITSRLSETTLGLLKQDETDTLRQEYLDFSIPLPTRQQVVPSLGGYFNRSPYGVQLSDNLRVHYEAVLNAYRGRIITVGTQQVTIPPTADMQITRGGGFRSPRLNKAAGSVVRDSRHMRGRALDLKPIVFPVTINGRRTPVDLHGSLYPALQAAAATQGFAFAEQGATPVPLGDEREDHIHVEW